MIAAKRKTRVLTAVILTVLLMCITVLAVQLVRAADEDGDGDGFLDTVDVCPTSYGLVQGCFFYTPALSERTLTKENVVFPSCTTPGACLCAYVEDLRMVQEKDLLLLQMKDTPFVSDPLEVQ